VIVGPIVTQQFRGVSSAASRTVNSPPPAWKAGVFTAATTAVLGFGMALAAENVDYDKLRADIVTLLESNPQYEDGSYGPLMVRLAWHQAGTYSKSDGSGGSEGGRIRFNPEKGWGANAGLDLAMKLLEPLKQKYPGISYADLYSLAGSVALEVMGDIKVNWRPGRVDLPDGSTSPPDGRLPDAAQGVPHLRAIFGRMGFTDQEIVALSGAHALGRCHTTRSGFDGPWTNAPTMLTNDYFVLLTTSKWHIRKWNGPKQYQDESGQLMMLPTDMALLDDPEFKKWVEIYAKDEARFKADFVKAWRKLQENGVKALAKPWYQFW
jgi:cytochrome c peroxidase